MDAEAKPRSLFSRFVRQGKKSYFFDVYGKEDGRRWLAVTESRQMDDGKYVRNRINVMPDAAAQFIACLTESVRRLSGAGTAGAEASDAE